MQKIIKKTIFLFCSLGLVFNSLQGMPNKTPQQESEKDMCEDVYFENHKKAQMIQELDIIKHHFEVGYAPAEWKKEYAGWDLNEAFEKSKNLILTTPSITTKQFQQILRDFINTTKDYHVDVTFFSTESASLPFSVKEAENRYFIDWIDPLRLPVSHYGLRAGDELLEFDKRPIIEVIQDLIKLSSKSSNLKTDLGLCAIKLTARSGMAGDDVPKGAILIKTRSIKTGKIISHQLHWSYKGEYVKSSLDQLPLLDCLTALFSKKKEQKKLDLPQLIMANPLHQSYAKQYADRQGGLGSRKSFVPCMGEMIWTNEEKIGQEEIFSFWHAYIYRHPLGQNIGYIRIPHYMASSIEAKEFGQILNKMEQETDALVIDQVHNFGGFVHFQYALAAMLAQTPLNAPYHRIKITQKEVLEAYQTLEIIKFIELGLVTESNDFSTQANHSDNQNEEEAEEISNEINYQELLFIKTYCERILEDWNRGQTLTNPTPILGVDKINPNPKYHYSKPIVMLIDEMDFSGGDFIPAILQDNQRAILFGNRTAGAGGYVFGFQFPNSHGIAHCSYTASIAERANLQKIENLGVTPDIEYQITVEDRQNNYQGYVEAVNRVIQNLLEK